jgi:uncharacterized protein YceK
MEKHSNKIITLGAALILLACVVLTGCGTCFTLTASSVMYGNEENPQSKKLGGTVYPIPHIYSGTAADLTGIIGPFVIKEIRRAPYFVFMYLYAITDLPLSFAADTLMLPYTVPRQIVYGNIFNAG